MMKDSPETYAARGRNRLEPCGHPNRTKRDSLPAFVGAMVAVLLVPVVVQASPYETRTYLDIGTGWHLAPKAAPRLTLGPFVREENRFRDTGLHYAKTFVGVRMRFCRWSHMALYYAHKDFPKSQKPQAHLLVMDWFVDVALGPFVVWDKSGFEAHVTDKFFRYRNALEVRWQTPLGWLAPFARTEMRVDSDAERINLVDAWGGLIVKLPGRKRSHLSLRLFYGYEINRRGRDLWQGINFLGIALTAHI